MSELEKLRELLRQRDEELSQRDEHIRKLENTVESLHDSNRRLLQRWFGRRNENYYPGQLSIPIEGLRDVTYDADAACEPEKVIPARTVKPKRKRSLWSEMCPHLPIEKEYIALPEAEQFDGDGTPLIKSGTEIAEELVYTPGTVHIRQIIRQRYARSDTAEKKAIAPVPAKIVAGGAGR